MALFAWIASLHSIIAHSASMCKRDGLRIHSFHFTLYHKNRHYIGIFIYFAFAFHFIRLLMDLLYSARMVWCSIHDYPSILYYTCVVPRCPLAKSLFLNPFIRNILF